jgi:holo-[acyl-carrier protein] synthase
MIVGVGHDVFEVARMETELHEGGASFRTAVFTPAEVAYCEAHRYPARHFAARFAAKEAVLKALGGDPGTGIAWVEIEVRNEATGRPRVHLHGGTSDLAGARGVSAIFLSLSHTATLAAATAVLESEVQGEVNR